VANTATTADASTTKDPGLFARMVGVLLSPKEAYAAVVARPRWFGVIAVVMLVIAAAQLGFLSTPFGKDLMVGQILDQQVRAMERSGNAVSDETYARMEAQMSRFVYVVPVANLVFIPLFLAAYAGLLTGWFTTLLGGAGTFRQVFAIMAHSSVIVAIQAVFTTALTFAAGRVAGANLAIFFPTLEETAFATRLLESIDLFLVWSTISTAIGLGVLYKKRTGPIATGLLTVYLVIALLIAYMRSGS
jgi:hypothetical protein